MKGVVQAYAEYIKDLKFVIYLGAAAQMIQIDQRKAIYLGGLGINYKRQVVQFKEMSCFFDASDPGSTTLKVSKHTA